MVSAVTSSNTPAPKNFLEKVLSSFSAVTKRVKDFFTGRKLTEQELKALHAAPKKEKLEAKKLLSLEEQKLLTENLRELKKLCNDVIGRNGDVGVFFTDPENPQDPMAKFMDKTIFNLLRTFSANKNDQELIDKISDEILMSTPVHVGSIINNNGCFTVVHSDLRAKEENQLRVEKLEDLALRSMRFGSRLNLYHAGYSNSPATLIHKFRKDADKFDYSVSNAMSVGANIISNGTLNRLLNSLNQSQTAIEKKLTAMKETKLAGQLKTQLDKFKVVLEKYKLKDNNLDQNKSNTPKNKEKDTKNYKVICTEFILDHLYTNIKLHAASKKISEALKDSNAKSKATPSSLNQNYLSELKQKNNNSMLFKNKSE